MNYNKTVKIKKIIDNNFIKLFKIINDDKDIFYSLYIKKKIKDDFIVALKEYNIKDVELVCDFDTLNLSYLNKIEYITSHSEIKKLIVSNINNIKMSGIIPLSIIFEKKMKNYY